jgi:photosystem II stability/assembly factor-like uncharacterized protein
MKKTLQALFCLILFFTVKIQAQTWTPQATGLLPANHFVYAISAVNKDVVWAVVDSTILGSVRNTHLIKVLKTTNGGTTWRLYTVKEAPGRFSIDIQAIDSNVAWITDRSGVLRKTTDGGNTWVSKYTGAAGGTWLRFFNPQTAIAWRGTDFARTQDGGETWTAGTITGFNTATNENVYIGGTNSCAVVGDTIWGGTDQSRIVRSTDKGLTWQFFSLQSLPNFSAKINMLSVAFKDGRNGMALGWNSNTAVSYLARTTDGGNTWTYMTTYPFALGASVEYIPGTTGSFVVCDTDGLSAYTTNFGQTWVKIDALFGNPIRFLNYQTGWIGKTYITAVGPAMYKWTGGSILSAIKVFDGDDIALKISPNPTSRFLTIDYSVDFKPTQLSIYDTSGKLVLEKTNLSNSSEMLDLQAVTNGVYLVQLKNREGVVAKKIVVQH